MSLRLVFTTVGGDRYYWGSAHNGYLEFLLDLGIVGLVLFLVGFVRAAVRAVAHYLRTPEPDQLWMPAVYPLLIVLNVVYSLFMDNTIWWIVLVSVTISATLGGSRAESTLDDLPRDGDQEQRIVDHITTP